MKAKIEEQSGVISMAGRKVGNIRFFERNGKVYSRIATTSHMTNDRVAGTGFCDPLKDGSQKPVPVTL